KLLAHVPLGPAPDSGVSHLRPGDERAAEPASQVRRDTVSQLSADDRLAIREIIATYCHALDLGRWEEFVDLFSDDCRLDFGSLMGVYEGREGVRRFGERIQGLGRFMRHYPRHVGVPADGDHAAPTRSVPA